MPATNAVSLCLLALLVGLPATSQPFLDQNWTDEMRHRFWFLDQGSRMMPLQWFLRLERAGSTVRFSAGLERFGFIPDDFNLPGELNKYKLPVGFAVDHDGKWVGLTCAACHTGKIHYGGKSFMIEGAPSMLDFDRFLSEMVDALNDTRRDQAKWNRFWADLPGGVQRAEFHRQADKLQIRRDINTPPSPAGFARVDAFGHIFNQVVVEHLGNDLKEAAPPDAPASYPALWDIAQHKIVQWNFSAPNLGVGGKADGSLIRNVGEVLGVFGTLEVRLSDSGVRYESSVQKLQIQNLRDIEEMISKLRSPAWPFDPIQEADKAAGEKIYQVHCKRCHELVDRKQPPFPFPAKPVELIEVGTDPRLAENFYFRRAPTRAVAGTLILKPFAGPETFTKVLTGHLALKATPEGTFSTLKLIRDALKAIWLGDTGGPLVYKARPLNGVWATAPYLHNGSVPSLREMLRRPQDRISLFCVGEGVYDMNDVGFNTYNDLAEIAKCPPRTSLVDTSRRGSSNQGHPFGTELSDPEKLSLIEFLKSL